MSGRKIVIEFLGKDKSLSRTAKEAERDTSQLGHTLSRVGKLAAAGLAVGVAAGGKALWDAGKAAAEDQKSQVALAQTLRRTTGATKEQVAHVEDWITKQGQAYGVADDDLRPALQRLAEATGSVSKAQRLSSLAMNISAGTGKSLKTVSEALAKAQMGNVGALSRYGIRTKDAAGKTMSFEQVVKGASKTFAGQAAKSANTLEGKIGRLRLRFSEAMETVGYKLIPALIKLADWFMNEGLPVISRFGGYLQANVIPVLMRVAQTVLHVTGFLVRHRRAVAALAAVIGTLMAIQKAHAAVMAIQTAGGLLKLIKATKLVTTVTKIWTAAQWLLNIALNANPIGIVILALAALGAAIYIAWHKSETFRKIVTTGLRKIAEAARWLGGKFGDLWRWLGRVWDGIKRATWSAVSWVVSKFLWFAQKIVNAAAFAFGWVPKLGDKLRRAKDAVARFRDGFNREMDRIRDEDVNVRVNTSAIRKIARQLGTGPLGLGGGGPIPARLLGGARGGSGGGVGGAGLIPHIRAPLGPVHRTAGKVQHGLDVIKAALIRKLSKKATDAVLKAFSGLLGGRAGRVLPRGSYSVGMPIYGYPGHTGQDLPARIGTPVFSPWAGRVIASYDLPGRNPYNRTPFRSYGRVIKIAHANGLQTLYAHLSSRLVGAGRLVRAGQTIGRVGMNGNATGPHLHLEARRGGVLIDPRRLGIFDRGGSLAHGGLALNLSGQRERVLNPQETRDYENGGFLGTVRLELTLDGRVIQTKLLKLKRQTGSELGLA